MLYVGLDIHTKHRMRDENARGQRLHQVVEVAIAAAGLVAEIEAIRQALEDLQHPLDAPHARAVGYLPASFRTQIEMWGTSVERDKPSERRTPILSSWNTIKVVAVLPPPNG
jgi:hypothetical protein